MSIDIISAVSKLEIISTAGIPGERDLITPALKKAVHSYLNSTDGMVSLSLKKTLNVDAAKYLPLLSAGKPCS